MKTAEPQTTEPHTAEPRTASHPGSTSPNSANQRRLIGFTSEYASMQFLRVRQVSERVGLSRSTIYQLVKAGNFPSPVKIGARAPAWLASEVDEWQQQRIAAARKAA